MFSINNSIVSAFLARCSPTALEQFLVTSGVFLSISISTGGCHKMASPVFSLCICDSALAMCLASSSLCSLSSLSSLSYCSWNSKNGKSQGTCILSPVILLFPLQVTLYPKCGPYGTIHILCVFLISWRSPPEYIM